MLVNNVLFLTRSLTFTLWIFFLCVCDRGKERRFATIGLWIVKHFHFFLLIMPHVLYSLKCGQFHFNTPLSASYYLNNLLHFSLFIMWQPFFSSPCSKCCSFSPTKCLLNVSPLLRTARWWRGKKEANDMCGEGRWRKARREVWAI